MRGDLTTLDAEEVDSKMQVLQADAFSLNRKVNSPVTEKFVLVIDEFKPVMPLIVDLGNPAMQSRHWEQLCKAMGKNFDPSTTFSLEDFLAWGITSHAELASDVSSTASGEFQLEKGLAKMEAAWETLAFVTKEWRTSYILVSTDEIQQELDDQIVKTQAMRGSSASQRPKHLARPPKATV
jgi:dynein heavy chain